MPKFNIITSDENWKKVKVRAATKGLTIQAYLDNVFRVILDRIDEQIIPQAEDLTPKSTVDITGTVELQSTPVKGNCKNCGYFKLVEPHIFIFGYEQVRITDNLCDTCWKKAKQDGSARE